MTAPLPASMVGVRPQLVSLVGSPGSSRSIDLFLRNYDKTRPATVYQGTADAVQQLSGGLRFETAGKAAYSCAPWMRLDSNKVTIPAGTEARVKTTISFPTGDLRGSFHGIITVSNTPPTPIPTDAPVASIVRVAFGVIIHCDVAGTLKHSAEVENISIVEVESPGTKKRTRALAVRLANTGNSLLRMYGDITLRTKKRQLIDRWRVGTRDRGEQVIIYPSRKVEITLPLKRALQPGEYEAEARFTYAQGKTIVGILPLTVRENAADNEAPELGPFKPLTIGLGMSVDSELKEIVAAKGALRTGVVTVTNNEATPIRVSTSTSDLKMDPDGVLTTFVRDENDPTGAARWLKAGPTSFRLHPGESRKIQYSVRIAKDFASEDDLIGLLQFRARYENVLEKTTGPEIIGETGVMIIVSPDARAIRSADIDAPVLAISPEDDVVRLGLTVQNVGHMHFFLSGTMTFTGLTDKNFCAELPLSQVDVNPLVLPGDKRTVWIQLPADKFPPGEYGADLYLTLGSGAPVQKKFKIVLKPMDDLKLDTPEEQPAK